MFGMEKEKKKTKEFVFDIEKELKSVDTQKELVARIQTKIRRIKDALHQGSKKEEFDQLGILLNGYHALAIVCGRATAEPEKKKK